MSGKRAALLAAGVVLLAGAALLAVRWPGVRVGRLIAQLEDPERHLPASQELLELGPEAVPALLEVARDPAHPARGDAVELLGRIGDERALPAVLGLTDPGLARVRLEALGRLRGPGALEAVLAALDPRDRELELTALIALEEWPDPEARQAPALLGYLAHEQEGFRVHAARGLGARRHEPAVPALVARLSDPVALVREAAALALLQIGTREAVAAVEAARDRGAVSFEE